LNFTELLLKREKELGRPVRVGLAGAGQMGSGLAAQIGKIPGMSLVACADIDISRAEKALKLAGIEKIKHNNEASQSIDIGQGGVVDKASALADLPIDIVFEATGVPWVGAEVANACIDAKKHILMLNVETDVTIGMYLANKANRNGVVYSVANGDEPVACKELYDFSVDLGFEVVCVGKGKNNPLDQTANPDTCLEKATKKNMNPKMLASFEDGSKTMIEMTALANAINLPPDKIGMNGPVSEVSDLNKVLIPKEDGGVLTKFGVVDYAFGPAPGVFSIVKSENPTVIEEMEYLSMGEGPYYTLYRPYHLASIEAPRSIGMAIINNEPGLQPKSWIAEVIGHAKKDLKKGERIDGIGGFASYGVTYPVSESSNLVPLGLLEGSIVTQDIKLGDAISYDSVELPENLINNLRKLQEDS
jgi:predicted homoserine dehydrogenase-like protein